MSSASGNLKKWTLIITGTISLGLGIIGIFIPILPTTPFLLIAAICYMHSSPHLYHLLVRNRFFGCYIKNYLEGRGMPVKIKIWTLILLWVAIIATTVFLVENTAVRVILIIVAAGVTVHMALLKQRDTLHPESHGKNTVAGDVKPDNMVEATKQRG